MQNICRNICTKCKLYLSLHRKNIQTYTTMIRTAINNQMEAKHLNTTMLSAVTGISVPSLTRFLSGEVTADFDNVLCIMKVLGLGFGYKRVGVAVKEASDVRTMVSDILHQRSIKTKDLSILCGVNYCTLSSWLGGKRKITLSNLESILNAVGLTPLPII